MKAISIRLIGGGNISIIPGMKTKTDHNWQAAGAYIRVEDLQGKYIGAIESTSDMKRIRDRLNKILEARGRK